jgi:hypothetical protein
VSLPPGAALAPGIRDAHGTAKAAPAPAPYCRKRLRVIGRISSPLFMDSPSRQTAVAKPSTSFVGGFHSSVHRRCNEHGQQAEKRQDPQNATEIEHGGNGQGVQGYENSDQ